MGQRFYTFSDHLASKSPGEGAHTFDNGKVDAILQHALHETTVYLESLQRQVFKLKFLSQKGESSQ